MSVRLDAAADRLLRTTDLLNYNSPYTVMAWFYSISLPASSQLIIANRNDDGNEDSTRWSGSSSTHKVYAGIGASGTDATGSALPTATWYHNALVRESTTSLKGYIDGVLDATSTENITGRSALTRLELGGFATTNLNPHNCRIAHIKAWTVALTAAEVALEMMHIRPVKFDNLYQWSPLWDDTDLADYSGLGRPWTAGGTLTAEQGPPVSW